MSKKAEIAELRGALASALEEQADLEARVRHLHAELRDAGALRETLVAMVLRAAREMGEPRLRASFLEEVGELVPGALDEVPVDERPAALRRRLASRSDAS